ncbi:dihydrofolate reductase [Paenibacillus sp. J31TS4]|uniref:dihydrofolate reductase n=1 Tax=Paenibacillus sp. J31TS4 TaxID=2807195 RepID=UPI001B0138C6|nr:dihydrofolate reductase [Paenibacillus sp. J31TS4]GIP38363.1 dihydrofolate reductase [Paenibacillus sp. J31TS4]
MNQELKQAQPGMPAPTDKPPIVLVVAMARNRVIGADNKMPWRLPADLKHFRKVTLGHTILMGRKTFESIGKPLDRRTNVILTSQRGYAPEGCVIVHSVEEALENIPEDGLYVIGGGEVFRQVLPYADEMWVTLIDEDFEGDALFPKFALEDWILQEEREGVVDDNNKHAHTFRHYVRSRPSS